MPGKPLFDGQGEIEQLDKICAVLGTPNEEVWPGLKKLPNWGKVRRVGLKGAQHQGGAGRRGQRAAHTAWTQRLGCVGASAVQCCNGGERAGALCDCVRSCASCALCKDGAVLSVRATRQDWGRRWTLDRDAVAESPSLHHYLGSWHAPPKSRL